MIDVVDRPLFFDTNVLLYLFGNMTYKNRNTVDAYSTLFMQCLTKDCKLCVDTLVLSEFINRLLRFEYENYLKKNTLNKRACNFKQFRSSSEGIQTAQDIETIVNERLLKHFMIVGKVFKNVDISSIGLSNTDFNDALIIKICQEHQCVLVTHDADFSAAEIDILSANPRLLTAH